MAVTTKEAAIQVVVDDIQAFVESAEQDLSPTDVASLYWQLGRLDVLATYVNVFTIEVIGPYLREANEALAAAKGE